MNDSAPNRQRDARPAVWVRALAALPLGWLYGLGAFLAFLAHRVTPYRPHVVRQNLSIAFPELDEAGLKRIARDYYRGFAQVLVEILKAASLRPEEVRARVAMRNLDEVRRHFAEGRSVVVLAAHQCNWEWMLLALSVGLGVPVDAAYKPLVNPWAEREMLKLRTRLGARMVPADELLADIIKRSRLVRAIALVADQEPKSSEHKHWVRFLNRDSAFFVGPEEICRVTGLPAFFMAMRRTARGRYEITFEPLVAAGEKLPPGFITQRYAERVERQIREAPADWPWSHKRWRLKRPLYGARMPRAQPDG
jgi:Kdo2-lipid IVA lauroyltransferase/acyltransferase